MKGLLEIFAVLIVMMLMSSTSFAEESMNGWEIEMDGSTIDILQLAEQNDVDPYELKEAIEDGGDKEIASPFSSLATNEQNTMASQLSETVVLNGSSVTKESKTNQDSTAYVAKSGAQTASGKTPVIGMCAMDKDVTTKTGETTATKIKLGKRIYMEEAVNVNGTTLSSFAVEDRGNPSNRTDFWIDIYFGEFEDTSSSTYKAAINYGIQTVSYFYYY